MKDDLRIGVRREEGALQAHAWVEYAGRLIGEEPDIASEFAPLLTIEST